jgi:O-antigen ligase
VALHAIYVAAPYIASGGRLRSFGLSEASFDDISMFALPVSLAFFLWGAQPRRWLYLIAGLISSLGLVATQSRAPIIFCAIGTISVIFASLWSAKRIVNVNGAEVYSYVRRRIARIMLAIALAVILLTVFLPSVFSTAFSRFNHLIDGRLGETIFLRATLWKAALTAFLDHPVLGIGAGSFRSIKEMYPGLTLDPVYFWVRGFSAHNLFFHYLAETGIVGASLLVLLFWKTFSMSRKVWRKTIDSNRVDERQIGVSLALYVVGGMLLFSTFIDAGWMWGQTSYVFIFFAALISRHFVDATEPLPIT